MDKQGANLFFQLIARRHEKNSTIITTNQPFSKWGKVFSDLTLANALLDRLLHHSHILKITGPSYRLKDVYDDLAIGTIDIKTFVHFYVKILVYFDIDIYKTEIQS